MRQAKGSGFLLQETFYLQVFEDFANIPGKVFAVRNMEMFTDPVEDILPGVRSVTELPDESGRFVEYVDTVIFPAVEHQFLIQVLFLQVFYGKGPVVHGRIRFCSEFALQH